MTVTDFQSIGGTVSMGRNDPKETRWLAELPHGDTLIRRRGPSAAVAIAGVMAVREGL